MLSEAESLSCILVADHEGAGIQNGFQGFSEIRASADVIMRLWYCTDSQSRESKRSLPSSNREAWLALRVADQTPQRVADGWGMTNCLAASLVAAANGRAEEYHEGAGWKGRPGEDDGGRRR